MYDDEGDHPITKLWTIIVMVPLFIAGQVVALGGMWAAWAGEDFIFWTFAETGQNIGALLLILFIGEPLVMFAAKLVATLAVLPVAALLERRSARGNRV